MRNAEKAAGYLSLRPHHLLCLQKYTGHGYDETFTLAMDRLVSDLKRNPAAETILSEGCDMLCSVCPNNDGGACINEETVRILDDAVLAAGGLEKNQSASFERLAEKTRETILNTSRFEKICGDCSWYDLCRTTPLTTSLLYTERTKQE